MGDIQQMYLFTCFVLFVYSLVQSFVFYHKYNFTRCEIIININDLNIYFHFGCACLLGGRSVMTHIVKLSIWRLSPVQ